MFRRIKCKKYYQQYILLRRIIDYILPFQVDQDQKPFFEKPERSLTLIQQYKLSLILPKIIQRADIFEAYVK